MPKIRQNSPTKGKSTNKENATKFVEVPLDILADAADLLAQKEDGIDLEIRDNERKTAFNVQSDPTSAFNSQRQRRSVAKRNYR